MNTELGNLRRFEKRVRNVRAWRGLAIGMLAGGGVCTVWAALDWFRIAYAEWLWMGIVIAAAGLLGAIQGYFAKVSTASLSDSIDRRGGLQDRLKTSLEAHGAGGMETALRADTAEHVRNLKPNELYPVRFGKLQMGAIGMAMLASAIFLLGNSPAILPPEARRDREELKKLGESVERIARPLTEHDKPQDLTAAEKRIADELRKLQRDLQKSRLNKEEALQQVNELAKNTKELVKERATLTQDNLNKAETALEKLQKAELEKAGIKMDPETLQALKEMNQAQSKDGQKGENGDLGKFDPKAFEQAMRNLDQKQAAAQQKAKESEQKMLDMKKQLDKINLELKNPNLTDEQRKALEAMQKQIQDLMKKLEKELAEANKAIERIMKDKKVQELLRKIQEHPKMKELQELAAKLAENAKVGEMGEMPELSQEDIEALKEKLKGAEAAIKQLAEELSQPGALDEYLDQLKEALENMDQLELNASMCFSCISLFNLPIPGLPSPSNPIDFMGVDTGRINKNESGKEGQGDTTLTKIKGDRRKEGDETYIEIKGPTTYGNRTGVKYTKVIESSKKKAEEAINRKSIPKQHQKRVREYFESLTGGK
jgi:hypothetical protein